MNVDRIELKKNQTKEILEYLRLDKGRTNERSCLVLLALAGLQPMNEWESCEARLLTTFQIMSFIREKYNKDYAPNSRETIRRQTLHQFEYACLIERNRDDPSRPTNSKDNNYSLNPNIVEILKAYPCSEWKVLADSYLENRGELMDLQEEKNVQYQISVETSEGISLRLSPGEHNQLQKQIIEAFSKRFIGDPRLLYVGDTAGSRKNEGGKYLFLNEELFEQLGIPKLAHDKLPDVVIFDNSTKWLFLIEAVTSHGPINNLRKSNLKTMFQSKENDIVYVTAFIDQATFRRYAADIAWETEVWISNEPDHMIHFNGDRFLGPHND